MPIVGAMTGHAGAIERLCHCCPGISLRSSGGRSRVTWPRPCCRPPFLANSRNAKSGNLRRRWQRFGPRWRYVSGSGPIRLGNHRGEHGRRPAQPGHPSRCLNRSVLGASLGLAMCVRRSVFFVRRWINWPVPTSRRLPAICSSPCRFSPGSRRMTPRSRKSASIMANCRHSPRATV